MRAVDVSNRTPDRGDVVFVESGGVITSIYALGNARVLYLSRMGGSRPQVSIATMDEHTDTSYRYLGRVKRQTLVRLSAD